MRLRTGKTNVISLILNTEEGAMGLVSEMVYGTRLADTPYHLVITPYSLSDPMEPVRYIVETQSAGRRHHFPHRAARPPCQLSPGTPSAVCSPWAHGHGRDPSVA